MMKLHGSRLLRGVSLVIVSLGLAIVALSPSVTTAEAQSGRKPPKRGPSMDPASPPRDAIPSKPMEDPPAPSAPTVPILVVKNLVTIASSSILTNVVLDGCLEELKQSRAVQVSSGKDKNRKEASDYAKASKDTYVLLIQLESEMSDPGTVFEPNLRSLFVSYMVFTPGTGKITTQGRVFQGQTRGPLGVPVPNTPASAEYELRRCGREAADRVLDALNLARSQRR